MKIKAENKKVYKNTIKINSVSSTSQIATPKTTVSEKGKEYKIPNRYYSATLILLPVNPSLAYIYWDMDRKTENIVKNQKDASLSLNIMILRNNENVTIEKVMIEGGEGNYYLHSYLSGKKLKCEIGLLKDGKFKAFMSSNEVSMPKDNFSSENEKSLWMTKGDKKSKQKIIIEALLSSINTNMPTSEDMVGKEILHRISAFITRQEIPSSFSLSSASAVERTKE